MTAGGLHILLLGSGGREHAQAWKIVQSPLVAALTVLPGSDGIALLPKTRCTAGNAADVKTVLQLAATIKPDLIVIGPEAPLAAGVSDALRAEGYKVAAPSQAAAKLESSKIFSKSFMMSHGIPTADFAIAVSPEDAAQKIAQWDVEGSGIVVKADGLAAGKGVVVTHDRAEALDTVHAFMTDPACSVKSDMLLLEQKITGREVSAFALCDGTDFVTIGYACDYKRVHDGDLGPNTGGMGGYAPENWPSAAARDFIERHIFRPVLDGMAAAGTPYTGFLFAGLMVEGDDVKVIEFNTRFGDPEAQILLPLIEGDIVPLLLAAAEGTLAAQPAPRLKSGSAVHIVMTSAGYPETFGTGMQLGQTISLPEDLLSAGGTNDNALLFIAGARKNGQDWQNTGGRVLGITATGGNIAEARDKAYAAIHRIHFDGAHWRSDIGR